MVGGMLAAERRSGRRVGMLAAATAAVDVWAVTHQCLLCCDVTLRLVLLLLLGLALLHGRLLLGKQQGGSLLSLGLGGSSLLWWWRWGRGLLRLSRVDE